jgi:RNA polymerase sigma-70 factor (ECF subfamily)
VIKRLGKPAPPPDPSTLAERSDMVRALRKLPPKQAAALVLRHYHGYTNREIAAALGVPDQTVASRLAAARAQLQAVLGNQS